MASPSSYSFKLWPLSNLLALHSPAPPQHKFKSKPYMTHPFQYLSKIIAMLPFFLIALICNAIDPLQNIIVSAHRQGFHYSWISRIVIRDLAVLFIFTGGWECLIYHSPLTPKLHPYKYNPAYPTRQQITRDVILSISTTLMGSFFEICAIHLWAHGGLSGLFWDWLAHPYSCFFWLFLMNFWRDIHFYFIHRLMHPWRIPGIPDLGRWLYKNVHYLHHKDSNPSAWSGIAMHPVQGFIYESAVLIPLFFAHHPIFIVTVKVHLLLAAILGHDGHYLPGAGNYNHYLHHAHGDCNYGTINVPLDWVFGNYEDGAKWRRQQRKK